MEKQIKGWRRSQKVELIETENSNWIDLSDLWDERAPQPQALHPPKAGLRETSLKTPDEGLAS